MSWGLFANLQVPYPKLMPPITPNYLDPECAYNCLEQYRADYGFCGGGLACYEWASYRFNVCLTYCDQQAG